MFEYQINMYLFYGKQSYMVSSKIVKRDMSVFNTLQSIIK